VNFGAIGENIRVAKGLSGDLLKGSFLTFTDSGPVFVLVLPIEFNKDELQVIK